MREGWEIKKLGDIAHFPTRRVSSLLIDVENYVGVDNLVKDRGGKVKATIVPRDGNCIEYRNGDILLGNIRPYLKKIWLANNQGGASGDVIIVRPNNPFEIISAFLFWCLSSDAFFEYDMLHCKGAKMPRGNKADILKYEISIPPIRQQEKAVAELDCLTGIIEKKKHQLKELDNLAQSIFYDMFGDPITNEKGWEVRKLGDCFPYMKNGANIKQERGASGLPITRIETLSGGVFNRDRLGYANIESIGKYEKNILNDGDILMSHINSKAYIGRAVVYHKVLGETIIHGMNLLRLIADTSLIVPIYAEMFFKTDYFKRQIASIRKDAVNQSSVATGDLKVLKVVLPTLDLQNAFVGKIEVIERQKELIKESIQETETLFNSRMDYWFN